MLRRLSHQVPEQPARASHFATAEQEIRYLRREVRRLREECDALRRAVAAGVRSP